MADGTEIPGQPLKTRAFETTPPENIDSQTQRVTFRASPFLDTSAR